MPDLIAQGAEPHQRWRRALTPGRLFTIGRHAASWSTPWDDKISRRHAQARWDRGRLEISKLPEARNPLFFRGRQTNQCWLRPGEHFVIGQTTFTLTDAKVHVSIHAPRPAMSETFSPEYLQNVRFRQADQRIEALSRMPQVISSAGSDTELCVRLVNLLLSGIPLATAAAVVSLPPAVASSPPAVKSSPPAVKSSPPAVKPSPVNEAECDVEVLHWDRRTDSNADFTPSARLICEAVESQQSRLHIWRGADGGDAARMAQTENGDWAFCTPVAGEACHGWALYVHGDFPATQLDAAQAGPAQAGASALRDDLKFAEVAAGTLGNLRSLRLLQHQQFGLSQFFSPLVLEALAGQDPDQVLAPREADVSVLFCDLRGFSRSSERSADDLLELLNRVSDALGVMTHHILEQGGVVGDFHGDAAMGFWGWPLHQHDAAERACRAALGIRAGFAAASRKSDPRLADFRIGIGIASGRAVAGKIGTVDQVKVTVFGPVVNLASRLETMTKILHAPILIDRPTADALNTHKHRDWARLRRVAHVRPYGLESAVEVTELLPPAAEYPQLGDEHLAAYEAALDALRDGHWSEAFQLLHGIPPEDRVKDFLTVFIAQHNRTPPPNWDGIIPLHTK